MDRVHGPGGERGMRVAVAQPCPTDAAGDGGWRVRVRVRWRRKGLPGDLPGVVRALWRRDHVKGIKALAKLLSQNQAKVWVV